MTEMYYLWHSRCPGSFDRWRKEAVFTVRKWLSLPYLNTNKAEKPAALLVFGSKYLWENATENDCQTGFSNQINERINAILFGWIHIFRPSIFGSISKLYCF